METLASVGDKNVLESPELLTHIFQYLSLPDLKSVRLVNKKFSQYAWPQLIKKSQVILDDNSIGSIEDRIQSYIDFFGGTTNSTTTTSPTKVATTKYKPCPPQNYTIALQAPPFDELVTKFYQIIGPQMRSLNISECVDLELDHSDQKSLTNLEQFWFRIDEVELPFEQNFKLKGNTASLKIFMSSPFNEDEMFKNLGEFLKRHKDNLVQLHFNDEHSLWYERPPTKLVKIILDAGLKKLKSLNLPGDFDNDALSLFANGTVGTGAGVTCQELEIEFNATSIPTPETFYTFFKSQANQLKDLQMTSSFSSSPDDTLLINQCKIPRMERLRSLLLSNAKGTLDFVNDTNFPVLERLELPQFQWEDKESSSSSSEICSSLKGLSLDRLENESKELISKLIVRVGTLFPNLEDLYIFSASFGILMNDHVELVKSNLPNVKKLTLKPSGIRDFDNLPAEAIREEVKVTF